MNTTSNKHLGVDQTKDIYYNANSVLVHAHNPNEPAEKQPAPAIKYSDLTGESSTISHDLVLERLLAQIQPIDFISLIKPESSYLIEELTKIEDAWDSGDKDLHSRLNKPHGKDETSRVLEIKMELKKIKNSIKQKHYVVCIITELLRICENNGWNLCKCYDYVYIFNGAFWRQLGKEDLKQFLGNAAINMSYAEIDAEYYQFKDDLLKQFLTQAHLPTPEHNPDKVLINLQNGTFEFLDGSWNLRQFDPKNFLTYQLPFGYQPEARSPLFDNYLNRVLPDAACRDILQEFAGFIFTKLNLEKCLVLAGSGQNGKSVFFNVLTALIGSENTLTFPLGMFNHEYNRSRLTNVLLNYSSEKGLDLAPDTFKALVSGEPLQAREPYGKPFTIKNKVRFILNCNELPKETESTEAYFRRFLIIPFDVKIPDDEKDINLADKIIKSELPGVFNWLLAGLNRLISQQKFSESEKVKDALADFKRQSDNVALFLLEYEYQPSTYQTRPINELYLEYKQFCIDDGYRPLGKNKFSRRLENRGYTRARVSGGTRVFYIEKI